MTDLYHSPSSIDGTQPTFTKAKWTVALVLATKWRFDNLRKRCIRALDEMLNDPIELILIGREAFVARWVLAGYTRLVTRSAPIS